MDEESAKVLVIHICKGLYFGIKTAPIQFQATMHKILTGMNQVFFYIDDTVIATDLVDEHLRVLRETFERFVKYNVHVNGEKCQFLKTQVNFLGHTLCDKGIRHLQSKVQESEQTHRSTNVYELK